MNRELEGKTALVTGASRGIGRAIALRLGEAGALVAVNYAINPRTADQNQLAAEQTVADIEARGGQAFAIQCELGDMESIECLIESVVAEFTGRTGEAGLDILVNNAAYAQYCDFNSTTPGFYDKTMELNCRVPFFLVQGFLPNLREGGRIVNISSMGGIQGASKLAAYSISKAALNMLTLILAKDLAARNITVNAVAPGFTETDAAAEDLSNPELRQFIIDNTLLGRIGQPEDIAQIVFSIVTGMDWVTGQIIHASGGFLV